MGGDVDEVLAVETGLVKQVAGDAEASHDH
jgi:hypothetical protein